MVISGNIYYFILKSLMPPTYGLHILYLQESGFHFLIFSLNAEKISNFFYFVWYTIPKYRTMVTWEFLSFYPILIEKILSSGLDLKFKLWIFLMQSLACFNTMSFSFLKLNNKKMTHEKKFFKSSLLLSCF